MSIVLDIMNPKRIWTIAANVFREVLRERVIYIVGLYTIAVVLAVLFLNEVSVGTEGKISLDVGLAGMALLGLAIAAFEGGNLVRKEIESKTALVLLAKPMSRAEFIVGKHLGLSAVLMLLIAVMTVVFLTIINWRAIDYNFGAMVTASLYIGFELSLMSAVAVLFGVLTSSLMATVLTFTLYFMGHLSHNLLTLSDKMEDSGVKAIAKGIYYIFPDLSRLDLKQDAVSGLLPDAGTLAANAGYGAVYIVLLLAIATWLFSYREF
jgi:Cu-processing system permease protein